MSDNTKGARFPVVKERSYKYGKGEKYNEPCNVGLELRCHRRPVFSLRICQRNKYR